MSAGADFIADRRQVLAGAGAATLLATPIAALSADIATPTIGRGQSFDAGWRFRRGEGDGFEAPGLDDSGWRTVDLPHDWSIEDLPAGPDITGPFDRHAPGNTATGFTIGGDGWYRKRFRLAGAPRGRVELVFDGVYRDSEVWINGHRLGAHPSGYTPFAWDLTPHLAGGGDNLVAVRVRNRGRNSRWYSGSGIYRHVWLDVLPEPARIARWGVGISTRRITDAGATLDIAVACEDIGDGATLHSRIRDAAGRVQWEVTLPARDEQRQTCVLRAPRLWSPAAPTLYTLETELRRGTTLLDRHATAFGVRIVTFDAERGMAVNGAPTKLRGGCIHHDHGLLGAASFDAAEERKVMLLKARGYNAIRGSHNPYAPAFLSACDRHGMLVISEAFDAWREGKLPDDYATVFDANWRSDLTTIVGSQRNHPSIIAWSIGNEIPGRNSPDGVRVQWDLANHVHRLDPTRPVTAAINDFPGRDVVPSAKTARPGFAGVPDQTSTVFLDVVGYNYKLSQYARDHAAYPRRILYGSESFPKDVFAIWDLTDRSPYLLGDFVWIAMDYLGEAGIGGSSYGKSKAGLTLGAWPWIDASCGDIDLIGRQKAASLARDVVWGLSPLEIAVQKPVPDGKVELIPFWGWSDERICWTWPGAEGRPLAVRIYTVGDRVELRLDGRLVGAKPVTPADLKHVEIAVPYAPGTLEAVAFRGAREIARRRIVTTGAPAAIRVTPERRLGGAGRGDVHYVAVDLVDSSARAVRNVEHPLIVAIEGPVELAAFGSANPFANPGYRSTTAKSWDGRALVILRGTGAAGPVRVTVSGEGLTSGHATLSLTNGRTA